MCNKISAALVIIGIALTFDACAQAEYAMIWADAFRAQSIVGLLLAGAGLLISGVLTDCTDCRQRKGGADNDNKSMDSARRLRP